ncbi:MAG TPA: hypothetical protein VHV55_07565 [Pirellulales bacterium]|jgi:hypothetical protein|nr:hypothetical protein [Pirellulales bacterium]
MARKKGSKPRPQDADRVAVFARIPSVTLQKLQSVTGIAKPGPLLTELANRLALREDLLEPLWRQQRRGVRPLRELTLVNEILNWASYGEAKGFWSWALAGYAAFLKYVEARDDATRESLLGHVQWARYRAAFSATELGKVLELEAWRSMPQACPEGFNAADRSVCYAIAWLNQFAERQNSAVIRFNRQCAYAQRARLKASLAAASGRTGVNVLPHVKRELKLLERELKERGGGQFAAERNFFERLWAEKSPLLQWRGAQREHQSAAEREQQKEIDYLIHNSVREFEDLAGPPRAARKSVPDVDMAGGVDVPVHFASNPSDSDLGLFARLAAADDDLILARNDPVYGALFDECLGQFKELLGSELSARGGFERIEVELPTSVREIAARMPYFMQPAP